MPSRLKSRDDIPEETIDLGGEDWVKVRRWKTGRDTDEINSMIATVNPKTGKATINTGITSRATVKVMANSWGGPGLCEVDHFDADAKPIKLPKEHVCKSVPITLETIGMLPEDDLRSIVNRIKTNSVRGVATEDEDEDDDEEGVPLAVIEGSFVEVPASGS